MSAALRRPGPRVGAALLGCLVEVYCDEILTFSKTREEHLVHVRMVLDTLRHHKLYPKASAMGRHPSKLICCLRRRHTYKRKTDDPFLHKQRPLLASFLQRHTDTQIFRLAAHTAMVLSSIPPIAFLAAFLRFGYEASKCVLAHTPTPTNASPHPRLYKKPQHQPCSGSQHAQPFDDDKSSLSID